MHVQCMYMCAHVCVRTHTHQQHLLLFVKYIEQDCKFSKSHSRAFLNVKKKPRLLCLMEVAGIFPNRFSNGLVSPWQPVWRCWLSRWLRWVTDDITTVGIWDFEMKNMLGSPCCLLWSINRTEVLLYTWRQAWNQCNWDMFCSLCFVLVAPILRMQVGSSTWAVEKLGLIMNCLKNSEKKILVIWSLAWPFGTWKASAANLNCNLDPAVFEVICFTYALYWTYNKVVNLD